MEAHTGASTLASHLLGVDLVGELCVCESLCVCVSSGHTPHSSTLTFSLSLGHVLHVFGNVSRHSYIRPVFFMQKGTFTNPVATLTVPTKCAGFICMQGLALLGERIYKSTVSVVLFVLGS